MANHHDYESARADYVCDLRFNSFDPGPDSGYLKGIDNTPGR